MAQMLVFVSHSHKDTAFCQALVNGLRDAGADVWYDEHNMGPGRFSHAVEVELRRRPVFVVILSPAAMRSQWVEDETRWAYRLLRKDASRSIQPVTASAINEDDVWLFLQDFNRIETSDCQPLPADDALRHLLHALGLTSSDTNSTLSVNQPSVGIRNLVERGKLLWRAANRTKANRLLERAVQLQSSTYEDWFNMGEALSYLYRKEEAISAYNQALTLDPHSAAAYAAKGECLSYLQRYEETIVACDRALALDPNYYCGLWFYKGNALEKLERYEEALDAFDQGVVAWEAVDQMHLDRGETWFDKGTILGAKTRTLIQLGRFEEALTACEQWIGCDNTSTTWYEKGRILNLLGRYDEAEPAMEEGADLYSDQEYENRYDSMMDGPYEDVDDTDVDDDNDDLDGFDGIDD